MEENRGSDQIRAIQRFEEKKKNLNLPDDYGVGDMNDGKYLHHANGCHTQFFHSHLQKIRCSADAYTAPERVANQTRHRQDGITTVVTTSAIAYNSDDPGDAPSSSSDDEGDQHQPRAVLAPTRAVGRSNIVRTFLSCSHFCIHGCLGRPTTRN